MTNYREILRLSSLQYSQRTIESMAHCSRHTVRDVLQAAKKQGISWPLSDDVANADLEQLLFPNRHKASSQYAEPDYPYIHRELARSGVTLTLLWEEYCAKCQEAGQRPYMSTQFGERYRRSAYLEEEKPCMLPLPVSAFEPAVWSVAKVANDYLVTDGRNKYSVPYNLMIGERVDIRVTKTTVEVFYHGSRVASHRRLQTRQRDPLVKREHMPPEHQKYLTYNADEFSRWAMSVGPMTEKVAEHFLKSGKAAEQGYKACAGLTKLEQRYGKQRLEAACGKTLAYSTTPSLRTIASILKNDLDKPDKAESQLSQSKANSYGITRGAAYFRKGGDR